jgi:hypothetical protein
MLRIEGRSAQTLSKPGPTSRESTAARWNAPKPNQYSQFITSCLDTRNQQTILVRTAFLVRQVSGLSKPYSADHLDLRNISYTMMDLQVLYSEAIGIVISFVWFLLDHRISGKKIISSAGSLRGLTGLSL